MSDDMRYLSIMTNDNSINIVCHAGGKKKSPYKAALKWIRLHISTPIKLESASQCLCLDIFVCVVVLISLSQRVVCIGKPHPSGLGEDRVVR